MTTTQEKIEILSVDLLNDQKAIVDDFKALSRSFGNYTIGWHYLLDWAWIFSQLSCSDLKDKITLDAGAWTGLSQWYLAEQGATVYSVDRFSRACLPFYFRRRYRVSGLRVNDLIPVRKILNPLDASATLREKATAIFRSGRGLFNHIPSGFASGNVIIYNQDLTDLVDIPGNSIDFIVSVSSLEHNTPDGLEKVTAELMRVLKPGGKLVATLCAGNGKDWFHKPSQGWCYMDSTLIKLFRLPADTPSNYDEYDRLMDKLENNQELRNSLAMSYYRSQLNGMPGGKWDPQYQPVGIVKVKY